MGPCGTLCVIPPPGLQSLLVALGLVRALAADTGPVLVAVADVPPKTVARLLHGTQVTFWVDDPDPVARAASLGMRRLVLPADPRAMYAAAKLPIRTMHAWFRVHRDADREADLVRRVVDAHGPSFVLAWAAPGRSLHARHLPDGIPRVDAACVDVQDPLDLCGLMERALQVHASDGWFLTLADLVGGSARKFCHAHGGMLGVLVCRRKYRRRVAVLGRGEDGVFRSPPKKCEVI